MFHLFTFSRKKGGEKYWKRIYKYNDYPFLLPYGWFQLLSKKHLSIKNCWLATMKSVRSSQIVDMSYDWLSERRKLSASLLRAFGQFPTVAVDSFGHPCFPFLFSFSLCDLFNHISIYQLKTNVHYSLYTACLYTTVVLWYFGSGFK